MQVRGGMALFEMDFERQWTEKTERLLIIFFPRNGVETPSPFFD